MSQPDESAPGSLGHVVVPCPRCGETRRVEVLGEVGSIERQGWARFTMRFGAGGADMGACYVNLSARKADDHTCPRPKRRKLRRVA